MADSDIVVSDLKVTPGIGHNALQYSISDPHEAGLLNLALDVVEVWASTSNDRSLATKVAEGNKTGALHMALVEGQTWYYWIKPRSRARSANPSARFYGEWFPLDANSGVIGTVGFAAGAAHALINGKLTAEVTSNELTISVKTLSGDDPSASNPVFVGFRSQEGAYDVFAITAPMSFVISPGSSLGTGNSACARLWVVIFDNVVSRTLAAINCAHGGAVLPLSEYGLASAVAEGGAGGADLPGVFYAAQTITSKLFRVIGFIEWTSPIATAGQWPNDPDVIHLVGPNSKLPGDVVQARHGGSSVYLSGVYDIPYDDSVPESGEGVLVSTVSLVPTSPCNTIVREFIAYASRSNAGPVIGALVEAAGQDGTMGDVQAAAAGNDIVKVVGKLSSFLNSVAARTYRLQAGATGGATLYVNGDSGGRKLGGSMISYLAATEIMS